MVVTEEQEQDDDAKENQKVSQNEQKTKMGLHKQLLVTEKSKKELLMNQLIPLFGDHLVCVTENCSSSSYK